MDVEIVLIHGLQITCKIVKMHLDGEYLFSSPLSYLVYGDVSMMAKIQTDIASHMSNNLQSFKCCTQQRSGVPYGTERQCLTDLSLPEYFIN
ncbi:hypothetical protein AVEN_44210-1 [Araneus ventricosus]|uniref:Uncharacterized protein n=1 Tax=Araneus ventricosus TaxID=182803 RepID=A0A4Y2X5L7_ARAVE|nr:hypothetical protein AVEN_44210-1 [Araneus ventricosus]